MLNFFKLSYWSFLHFDIFKHGQYFYFYFFFFDFGKRKRKIAWVLKNIKLYQTKNLNCVKRQQSPFWSQRPPQDLEISLHSGSYFLGNKKNKMTYGKHRILQHVPTVAPIPKNIEEKNYLEGNRYVMCCLSHVPRLLFNLC